MLGTLRKQSRSVIIYVLFAIIIVVFVFTFNVASPDAGCSGGSSASRETALVTIGDGTLDLSDLAMGMALSADPPPLGAPADPRTFQAEWLYRTTRFARLRGADSRYLRYGSDPSRASPIKARKVADDLIETFLVSEEARKLGLRVADHEVRDRLVAEFTDSDGQFRKTQYENWVRYGLKTSLPRFEDFVRREILRERMIDLVTAQVTVPEREARMVARLRSAKRGYEYLQVNPTLVARAIRVADDEVAQFLASHAEEARKQYDEHAADYRLPSRYDFHLAKFTAASRKVLGGVQDAEQKKALEESWADAKQRVEKAASELRGKTGDDLIASFEAMARANSDHSATRERGGRVPQPWTEDELGLLDPAVVGVLRTLEPGTLSEPVAADDGYYLLLLRERVPGRDRSFEEVQSEIARRILQDQRAPAETASLVQTTLEEARKDPSRALNEVAETVNQRFAPEAPVRPGETGAVTEISEELSDLVDRDPDAIPGIGASREMAEALRALTLDHPVADKAFEVSGAWYVVRLKSASEPAEPDAAEVKRARDELLGLKRLAWYREWYEDLRRTAAAQGRLIEHESLTRLVQDEIRSLEEARRQAPGPRAPR